MNLSDLDQQLQRQGTRWRADFPTSDSFAESLALAQQTRTHRAWLAPLAAAALVVAAVAGTVLATRGGGSHQVTPSAPIPWASPTVPVPSPSAPKPTGSANIPLCNDPGDFQMIQAGSAPAGYDLNTRSQQLRMSLQYKGKQTCGVTEFSIVLRLLDDGGMVEAVATQISAGPLVEPRHYDVQPGDTVIVNAIWPDGCVARGATRFQAYIGDQGVFTTPLPSGSKPLCPAEPLGGLHYVEAEDPVVARPGSADALVATIHAPTTARYGQTLDFDVTITNMSDQAVRLQPCPHYIISVFTGPINSVSAGQSVLGTQQTYQIGHALNCGQAPSELKAGRSLDWAMQLGVPLDKRPLTALGWKFLGTAGLGSWTPVTFH